MAKVLMMNFLTVIWWVPWQKSVWETGVSIHPEVLFSQTSVTTSKDYAEVVPNPNQEQIKKNLNYLSIPILLNVKLAGPLHVEAGPQFGILLNKDKKVIDSGKEVFKNGDFSVAAGAGLHLSVFRVFARYVIGLSNISNLPNQEEWKNQSIQAGIGIVF